MSLSTSPRLQQSPTELEFSHPLEHPASPTFSSTSPTLPESAVSESGSASLQEHRDEVLGTKLETTSSSSKIKKKFSELDFRGAMADLGGKRTGIEDFYIQLDEPHRMFWCPGEVLKGQVHLILDRAVKTQYVILKLIGMLSVSVVREKVEEIILEEEIVLWGTKIATLTFDKTYSRDDATLEYDTPKKQSKDEWEVVLMEEGEHPFPFEIDLPPKSMPSSINFGKGSITYTLQCIHQRPPTLLGALKNRTVRQKEVGILDIIDVACVRIPKPVNFQLPDHSKKGKSTGSIKAEVSLQKAGYLKGEQVHVNVKIRHTKPIKNLKGALVTLYRISRFDSPKGEPSAFRKDLAQTVSPIICDPQTLECNVSPRIRIPPDTFPTINTRHVSFRYYLEVFLDLNPKTSVFQTFSTSQDYVPEDEIKTGSATFVDTVILLKKNKPFVQASQFEIVVGTIDSTAKDLELQLQRQEELLRARNRPRHLTTFPSAPDLTHRRESTVSNASSTSSFARLPPPPPPFTRNMSSPGPRHVDVPGGPHSRSPSTSSRASISKTLLAQREQALLPSAPPETTTADQDASAPPLNPETEIPSEPPQIHISLSEDSISGLQIELPQLNSPEQQVLEDEAYLASLQSRVSAPASSSRSPPRTRVRRRPVSGRLEESDEASAPPLEEGPDDNLSVSDRVSVASTLPLYTERPG